MLVASNHLSLVDPFVLASVLSAAGRRPRMMGTAGLFAAPGVGWLLRHCAYIPVYRRSADPGSALVAALDALAAGQCVGLYPEGMITPDPDFWPGIGKTGVVRLALDSGAPVLPVAQWGAQRLLGPAGTRRAAPFTVLIRPRVLVHVGPALDLRLLLGVSCAAEATAEQLHTGAALVMGALTAGLELLRDQPTLSFPADDVVDASRGFVPRQHQRQG